MKRPSETTSPACGAGSSPTRDAIRIIPTNLIYIFPTSPHTSDFNIVSQAPAGPSQPQWPPPPARISISYHTTTKHKALSSVSYPAKFATRSLLWHSSSTKTTRPPIPRIRTGTGLASLGHGKVVVRFYARASWHIMRESKFSTRRLNGPFGLVGLFCV